MHHVGHLPAGRREAHFAQASAFQVGPGQGLVWFAIDRRPPVVARDDGVIFYIAFAPVDALRVVGRQQLPVGGAGGQLGQAGQARAIRLDAVNGRLQVLILVNEYHLPIRQPGGGAPGGQAAAGVALS